MQIKTGDAISLPGLSIYPDQRKIFRNRQEIHLTAKKYNLLCMLVENIGHVMTYIGLFCFLLEKFKI
ncbi:MAG TPA: hypothetical protein DDY31_00075 [Lachnospiraceae bacterium]|nr:hypothetical protein [Lachnospiraceae bacterium]